MRSSIHPALFAALACLAMASPGSAAESFYERLFKEGVRASAEGDSSKAVQDLTLACFGMLEEPKSLMACRIHLALAQAAQGDRDAFSETIGHIIELESRFEVYAQTPMEKSLRQSFEQKMTDWIPYTSLSSVKAFSGAARAQQEQELVGMGLAERRSTLEVLLAAAPTDLAWQIHMAEVELMEGKPQAALDRADAVLRQDTELLVAICVRGEARAALGRCEEALVDLIACDESGSRTAVIKRRLKCRIDLRQWGTAQELYDALPANEQRANRGLQQAIRRGQREDRKRSRTVPAETGDAPSEADGDAEIPQTPPSP